MVLTIINPYRLCNGICTSADEACCWFRKEYSTRNFYYVYSNRIVSNRPQFAFPWALCTIERWNRDHIVTHSFDRGSYGFSRVNAGTLSYCCCCWPLFGGVVARHTAACNGPIWNRMFVDCTGCWCDEWLCRMFCGLCDYHYHGLANPDEVAFASSIAVQAFFEGDPTLPVP